ncbi:MAG: ABC transporter permease [Ilumatobacteraceae bacterium]
MAEQSSLDATVGLSAESLSPGRLAFRRFLTHKGAVVSVVVLSLLVLWVLLSPITARYGVNEQVFDISEGANQNLPPSRIAWFGTDIIGRDVYSRVLYGVRVSLVIGIASAVFSLALGALIGAVAGLKGGLFDDIVMRVTDIFLAFPFLVALLVIRNMFGSIGWITWLVGSQGSLRFMVFLFAIFGWMSVARVLRAQVLSLKEREFVEAARALGASNSRIIVKHLLPNSIGPMLVSLSLGVVGAIVSEATLSLFGYGPDPGTGATSLGLLVSGSKSAVRAGYWWLALYPFAALLIITLCVSFIGDGLRDAFDPKHGGGRA